MAIIRSKVLGLYVLESTHGQTDPFPVGDGANEAARIANALANGAASGDKYLAVNGSTFIGLHQLSGTSGNETTAEVASTAFSLALAATNTSMDINNSVNEIVARDGQGGSETYIVLSLIHI